LNETITLSKVKLNEKDVYDTLNIYGFTLNSYDEEFVFVLTERHNILKRLGKKIVRTSGIQIGTKSAIQLLEEYHEESKTKWRSTQGIQGRPDQIIRLSDAEKEANINEPN
jgi:hypothetical protein